MQQQTLNPMAGQLVEGQKYLVCPKIGTDSFTFEPFVGTYVGKNEHGYDTWREMMFATGDSQWLAVPYYKIVNIVLNEARRALLGK
jgi:hypothetical protein